VKNDGEFLATNDVTCAFVTCAGALCTT